MSLNTFPELRSNRTFSLIFSLHRSHPVQPLSNQVNLLFRSSATTSGLFLERMKHIDSLANSNGIDGAIGIRVVTGDNLQHSRTDPTQRFCFWMFLSLLSKTQRFTDDSPRSLGKTSDLFTRIPNPCQVSHDCIQNVASSHPMVNLPYYDRLRRRSQCF